MKLTTIAERKTHGKSLHGESVRPPRNPEEAEKLFWMGMQEMKSRNDEAAFQIFKVLSRYDGEAPPMLAAVAKTVRDFLDPERTAEQRAKTLFDFFSPVLIRIYPEEEDGERDHRGSRLAQW
jgi:hypothetical protein